MGAFSNIVGTLTSDQKRRFIYQKYSHSRGVSPDYPEPARGTQKHAQSRELEQLLNKKKKSSNNSFYPKNIAIPKFWKKEHLFCRNLPFSLIFALTPHEAIHVFETKHKNRIIIEKLHYLDPITFWTAIITVITPWCRTTALNWRNGKQLVPRVGRHPTVRLLWGGGINATKGPSVDRKIPDLEQSFQVLLFCVGLSAPPSSASRASRLKAPIGEVYSGGVPEAIYLAADLYTVW